MNYTRYDKAFENWYGDMTYEANREAHRDEIEELESKVRHFWLEEYEDKQQGLEDALEIIKECEKLGVDFDEIIEQLENEGLW